MHDERFEHGNVCGAQAIETRFESAQKTADESVGIRLGVLLGQQVGRHRRHQGSRQQIRREHRVHDRQGERREEKARHAAQQHDWKEDDADRQRADQRGRGDLMRAVENRHQQRLVHRVIAMDVLDLDGRVIDQHSDRERDPAQRHRVDRLARELEADNRGQNRKRDRGDNDQHAARRPDEHQHHERDQHGRNAGLADYLDQRLANERRLIEGERNLYSRGRCLPDERQPSLDRVDHRERRCGRMPDDQQVGCGLSVNSDDVALRLMGIGHGCNVTEQDRRAIDDLHWQRIEVGHLGRAHVDIDVVFKMAHARGAGRDDHV